MLWIGVRYLCREGSYYAGPLSIESMGCDMLVPNGLWRENGVERHDHMELEVLQEFPRVVGRFS